MRSIPGAVLGVLALVGPARAASLSVGDAKAGEGQTATFTVTLAPAAAGAITVAYATGSGVAASGVDFTAQSGTLTFAPGATSATVGIALTPDAVDEVTETFTLGLSAAVGATLADGEGTGSITDDDPQPSLSIADATVAEGQTGTRTLDFTVTLSAPSGRTVRVPWATSDGTALAGIDYQARTGSLRFDPGQTTRVLRVTVLADAIDELAETVVVDLTSAVGASRPDPQAMGTIQDDDAPGPWSPAQGVSNFTVLGAAADDTVNPLRGFYRWRNQEIVPTAAPAQDAYQRYQWKDLETALGAYDFSGLLADRAAAEAAGRKFAFRIRMMAGYDDGIAYVPSYVVGNAQCAQGCGWWADAVAADPDLTFVPDWNDPWLQGRARALLAALAAALPDDGAIAWIDVGLYGQYGEWALSSSVDYAQAPSGILPATNASKREFVDMHLDAFPGEQLVMFALQKNVDALQYGLLEQGITARPVGLRIDCLGRSGFMDQWLNHAADWALFSAQWEGAPFVAEFCPFDSGDATTNAAFALQQIADFHVSVVGNGNLAPSVSALDQKWASFTPAEQADLAQVGRAAGYRIALPFARADLAGDGTLRVWVTWREDGSAPVYEPWEMRVGLVKAGNVVWSGSLGALPALGPGDLATSSGVLALPSTLAAGTYSVRVFLRDARRFDDPDHARARLVPAVVERDTAGRVTLLTAIRP